MKLEIDTCLDFICPFQDNLLLSGEPGGVGACICPTHSLQTRVPQVGWLVFTFILFQMR